MESDSGGEKRTVGPRWFAAPQSIWSALLLGVLVGAFVYVVDTTPWLTGAVAVLLAILTGIGERWFMRNRRDPRE